jgi:hypothetical protein
MPVMNDEQVALLPSFETVHREEITCQFMAVECEALAAILVVHANTTRMAARVAAEEEAAREAMRVAEVTAASREAVQADTTTSVILYDAHYVTRRSWRRRQQRQWRGSIWPRTGYAGRGHGGGEA